MELTPTCMIPVLSTIEEQGFTYYTVSDPLRARYLSLIDTFGMVKIQKSADKALLHEIQGVNDRPAEVRIRADRVTVSDGIITSGDATRIKYHFLFTDFAPALDALEATLTKSKKRSKAIRQTKEDKANAARTQHIEGYIPLQHIYKIEKKSSVYGGLMIEGEVWLDSARVQVTEGYITHAQYGYRKATPFMDADEVREYEVLLEKKEEEAREAAYKAEQEKKEAEEKARMDWIASLPEGYTSPDKILVEQKTEGPIHAVPEFINGHKVAPIRRGIGHTTFKESVPDVAYQKTVAKYMAMPAIRPIDNFNN